MPSLPPGFGAPQRGFDLSVVQEGQPASVRFEFKKPVTITVHLRASTYADLRRRPGAELVIMHYDQKDNFWDPLVTEVDLAAGTARARVDSLSIFALAARAPEPSPTATLEECYDVRSPRDKVHPETRSRS